MILGMLDTAEEEAFTEITTYLAWAGAHGALVDEVAEHVYNILTTSYNLNLSKPAFKAALKKETEALYKEVAKPRVNFTLWDQRAMTYLEHSDLVYLGKYVTNAEVKQQIITYLKEAYIKGGRAIGNSPSELRAFMDAFKEQLDLTKWQARRIIDTTVARSRVFGQMEAYRAAAGKTYEINGPMDNLTCEVCANMVGRKFSVATALSAMDHLFSMGPESAPVLVPFLKGSMSVDELKQASDVSLEEAGFALPPYHCNCRHFTTLVDSYEDLTQVPYSIE